MYFFEKAIGILVVSNPDSVRVLFDKNCFRVFHLKNVFRF